MIKMIDELLADLNNDLSLWEKLKKDAGFQIVVSYAFDKEKKMKLPEGIPPFRPDPAPKGMAPTNLRFESKRLYVFTRDGLTDKRREVLFVQMLEGIHPTEAKVLCHVKDQTLHKLYPNVTHDWAASVGLRDAVSKEEQKSLVSQLVKESLVVVESTTEHVEPGIEPELQEIIDTVAPVVAEDAPSVQVVEKEVKKGKGKK